MLVLVLVGAVRLLSKEGRTLMKQGFHRVSTRKTEHLLQRSVLRLEQRLPVGAQRFRTRSRTAETFTMRKRIDEYDVVNNRQVSQSLYVLHWPTQFNYCSCFTY